MDAAQYHREYVSQYARYWTEELVAQKIRLLFPSEQAQGEAVMILDGLMQGYPQETAVIYKTPRLKLAVLKVCGGTLDGLRRIVEEANTDPRDIFVAAEYPHQSRWGWVNRKQPVSSPPREIYDQDLAQYVAWIEAR